MNRVAHGLRSTLVAILVAGAIVSGLELLARRFAPSGGAGGYARYETPDFTFTVMLNSQGFRDREFPPKADGGPLRIAALGDSFTYGWGVAESNAWPRLLEGILRERGIRAEVFNLGRPGTSPIEYSSTAREILPSLRPDLFIVAVQQGEDAAQIAYSLLEREGSAPALIRRLKPDGIAVPRPRKPAVRFLPGLSRVGADFRDRLVGGRRIRAVWRHQVRKLREAMTPEEAGRYEALDGDFKTMFEAGGLNPYLLQKLTKDPAFYSRVFDVESAPAVEARKEMARRIGEIAGQGKYEGADTLVVAVPAGMCVSRKAFDTWRRLGFELSEDILQNDAGDALIREACEASALPLVSMTEKLRSASEGADLFFPHDGHLNAAGHRLFAEEVADAVSLTPAE